jgi:hypothetical protein
LAEQGKSKARKYTQRAASSGQRERNDGTRRREVEEVKRRKETKGENRRNERLIRGRFVRQAAYLKATRRIFKYSKGHKPRFSFSQFCEVEKLANNSKRETVNLVKIALEKQICQKISQ